MKHDFNEETGILTACIAEPGELDKAPKTQMVTRIFLLYALRCVAECVCVSLSYLVQVLSFSIGDLKWMAELLYPEVHGNSNNGKTSRSRLSHPLHREDPLYEAQDVQEQVRLLARRATPQKAQQSQHTQQSQKFHKTQKNASQAPSFAPNAAAAGGMPRTSVPSPPLPVRAIGTSSTAQNGGKDSHRMDATSSSSRKGIQHSVGSTARPAAHSHQNNCQVGQNSENNSEMNALDRMLPNGSCSSRYAATLLSGASSTVVIGMLTFALLFLHVALARF